MFAWLLRRTAAALVAVENENKAFDLAKLLKCDGMGRELVRPCVATDVNRLRPHLQIGLENIQHALQDAFSGLVFAEQIEGVS